MLLPECILLVCSEGEGVPAGEGGMEAEGAGAGAGGGGAAEAGSAGGVVECAGAGEI